MKIRWIGHASFQIETEGGLRIRTDPYDRSVGLAISSLPADILTISHDHFDHNAKETVAGGPRIVDTGGPTTINDVTFKPVAAFHDEVKGGKRGPNTIFVISVDGLRLAHMGDIGHIPSEEQIAEIGPVDILCIPVGGRYTLDAVEATKTVKLIVPKVTIPMHFTIPGLKVDVGGVEAFLEGKTNIVHMDELVVTEHTLPNIVSEIVVLKPRP